MERSVHGPGAAHRDAAAAVRAWVCWQKCQISSSSVNLIPLPYIARELCAHPPPFVQMCRGEAPEPLSGLL